MTADQLKDLMRQPTVSIEDAGKILSLSRNSAYQAAKSGEIPCIKLGRLIRVPTAKLREMLGIRTESSAA
jgi:excisionase family DNA binding protein